MTRRSALNALSHEEPISGATGSRARRPVAPAQTIAKAESRPGMSIALRANPASWRVHRKSSGPLRRPGKDGGQRQNGERNGRCENHDQQHDLQTRHADSGETMGANGPANFIESRGFTFAGCGIRIRAGSSELAESTGTHRRYLTVVVKLRN
jgi:hypothetical protein